MLTLQYMSYSDIEPLSPESRIKKLLDVVKTEKILLLDGRLEKEEEAQLIKTTMQNINGQFKGIELLVLEPGLKKAGLLKSAREKILKLLSGARDGITIIGPATIIKEIKKDPDKIQLLTVDSKKSKRRR